MDTMTEKGEKVSRTSVSGRAYSIIFTLWVIIISYTAYVTLWNAHRMEAVESYCKGYNAKYADVTKEAGLILVETVNLLMGLQASDVDRYSLEPFVVTRNSFGADPTVAVVQLRNFNFEVT